MPIQNDHIAKTAQPVGVHHAAIGHGAQVAQHGPGLAQRGAQGIAFVELDFHGGDCVSAVRLGGTDVDGTVTSVTVTTLPANGTLYLAGGVTPVVAGTPLTPAQFAEAAELVQTRIVVLGDAWPLLKFLADEHYWIDEKAAAKLAYRVNLIAVARKLLDAEQAVLDRANRAFEAAGARAGVRAHARERARGDLESNFINGIKRLRCAW